jgi:hypothetical protein
MTSRALDRAFWEDEFPGLTAGGTAPELFKGMLDGTGVCANDVLAGVRALRDARVQGTGSAAKARVYVGEKRRDDLADAVMTAPSWPDDQDFVSGMQALVGSERFSLIINNIETTSEHLSAGLGVLLRSVYEHWGVPVGGAEQVAFIGNYSGTAFGIHEGYEDAFLTHMGPGTKHFYCWPANVYEQLTGATDAVFGDYEWLLPHGRLFDLEPGDALFLPRGVFHVGVQSEFSVSVAIPLYTYPDERLLRFAILPEILDSVFGDGTMLAASPMQQMSAGWRPVQERLLPLMHHAFETAQAKMDDILASSLSHRWNSTLSNGGWEVVNEDIARAAATASAAQLVAPGATARLRPPYQICTSEDGTVYLRGVETARSGQPLPDGLADRLNSGKQVRISDNPSSIDVIRKLARTGGLTIKPAASHDDEGRNP